MDAYTHTVKHAVLGYRFNGEYCGDFELNPATLGSAKRNKDFTDVLKVWPPHTFIPEKLPTSCNELYPDGSDVILPSCSQTIDVPGETEYPPGDENPPGTGNPPDTESPPPLTDCPDQEQCLYPCHKKFLSLGGDCPSDTIGKYNPDDFKDRVYY